MIATLVCRYPGGVSDPVLGLTIPGNGIVGRWSASRGVTMTTAIYAVEELICQQWKAAVSAGVRPVLGVTEAAVDLDAGGRSPLMVMRGTKLGVNAVRETVENADFDPTSAGDQR